MKTPAVSILDPKKLRPLSGAIAGVLLLGGLWMGYSAWQHHQAEGAQEEVIAAQASVAAAAKKDVSTAVENLKKQVEGAGVQSALANSDWLGASAALKQGIKGASEGLVVPADLALQYDAAKPSYTRLAVMEGALRDKGPRASAMREGSGYSLAVAMPVVQAGNTVAVAYAQVPMKATMDAANKASVSDAGYLALRQGEAALVEHGNKSLSISVDGTKDTIKSTSMTVFGAAPAATGGPLGLGFIGGLIGSVVLLVLAALAGLAPKFIKPKKPVVEEPAPITIAEAAAAQQRIRAAEETADKPVVVEPKAPAVEAAPEPDLFPNGLVPGAIAADVDAATAEKLGRLIGAALHARGISAVALGRDGRDSSRVLLDGLAAGLVAAGRTVHDLGHAPTPVIGFAPSQTGAGASIAVIGNMRTITQTGLQVMIGGKALTEAELNALPKGATAFVGEPGERVSSNLTQAYLTQLIDHAELPRSVKVSVSGEHMDLLGDALTRHGATIIDIGPEVCISLGDNGAAIAVMDGKDQPLAPAKLLMLMAGDLLERAPGAEVVCDAALAEALASQVLAKGGIVKEAGPELSSIQATAVEQGAPLAGDSFGHVIVLDRGFTAPDGLFAAIRLVEMLAFVDHANDILAQD